MLRFIALLSLFILANSVSLSHAQQNPQDIQFTRQAVKRFIFDEQQKIPLASLEPKNIIGLNSMHPELSDEDRQKGFTIETGHLRTTGSPSTPSRIRLSGCKPFACA